MIRSPHGGVMVRFTEALDIILTIWRS